MPWSNVPASLWPEMERCVADVMKTGKSKDAATAICYASVVGKEARSGATFAVFKQADESYRWVLFSSSSFKDRDGEIVSQSAQDADTDRMNATGDFGTLDWWHVVPQAYDEKQWSDSPAPQGLIIGRCYFSAMHDKIRVEAGTFATKEVGAAIAQHVPELAASLSFYHPANEPDAQGVYSHIRTFSRALLPAGKESNLTTKLFVADEGGQMASLKEKWDAFVSLVGGEDTAKSIATQAAQAQREKEKEGVAFKAEESPPVAAKASYPWDQCLADQEKRYGDRATAEKVCGAIRAKYGEASGASMKAAQDTSPILIPDGTDLATVLKDIEQSMGITAKASPAPADTSAPAPDPNAAAAPPADDAQEPPTLGDLSLDQFAQVMAAVLQPLLDKMDAATMGAGKEAQALAQLQAKVKELEGSVPRIVQKARASHSTDTIVGKASGDGKVEELDPRFKETMPKADPIAEFFTTFPIQPAMPGGVTVQKKG